MAIGFQSIRRSLYFSASEQVEHAALRPLVQLALRAGLLVLHAELPALHVALLVLHVVLPFQLVLVPILRAVQLTGRVLDPIQIVIPP